MTLPLEHPGEVRQKSGLEREKHSSIGGKGSAGCAPSRPFFPLSKTQTEVVLLIALHGWSNQQIADHRCVARSTVKSHVHAAMKIVGLSERTQLALWAIKSGMVDVSDVDLRREVSN